MNCLEANWYVADVVKEQFSILLDSNAETIVIVPITTSHKKRLPCDHCQ